MKYCLLLGVLLFFQRVEAALSPPAIQCISLDEFGNVTLTWSIPADTSGEFTSYRLYYQDGASGPFDAVKDISDYDSSFTTLNGDFTGIANFYIVTISNGGLDVSAPSNIVSPLLLTITSESRNVTLTWEEMNLPSSDSIYRVYRNIDQMGWEFAGSTPSPATDFHDTLDACKATVRYYIEIRGLGGCSSRSNVVSRTVQDKTPPLQVNLLCASVDTATGFVNLEWEPSQSADGFGYQVNYFDGVVKSDTVFGAANTTLKFDRYGINALMIPETLSIAPFDSCFDTNTMWYNQAADSLRFVTLFLDTNFYDRCAGKVGLNWNNIPNDTFPVGVRDLSGFRVYRRDNGSALTLLALLSDTARFFLDSGLIKGHSYDYIVSALDEKHGKEAFSNVFKFRVLPSNAPDVFFVSSIENNHSSGNNEVHVLTDTTSEASKYGLFRTLYEADEFQAVAFSEELLTNKLFIEDPHGRADQTDYYYKVVAYDQCGDSMAESNTAKSMYITGYKQEGEYTNEIEWTDYLGFESMGSFVDHYELYRTTNGSHIDTLLRHERQFYASDTILDLQYVGGEVCYYAEAVESGTNQYGLMSRSKSNLFCLKYDPLIYLPNAFSPNDDFINDVFLPDVNFIDVAGYSLSIYDRAGNFIYKTSDPSKGWDGEGEPIGVYAYYLQLKNSRNEAVNLIGKVILFR